MATVDKTCQNRLKTPLWKCAVGLAEATRFHNVARAVMAGTPVPDIDWKKRSKAPLDYKVRVTHKGGFDARKAA